MGIYPRVVRVVGAATPKTFIEDMASSGFSKNKGLGGVLSLAGSKLHWCVIFVLDFRD